MSLLLLRVILIIMYISNYEDKNNLEEFHEMY